MKADVVKLIQGPYGLDYLKTAKSKVFLPMQMSVDMYNKIVKEMPRLEKYADVIDQPIYFYPKSENLTLMNMGSLTATLDNKLSQDVIAAKMYKHIQRVNEADMNRIL